jgi:predicted sugar kinase
MKLRVFFFILALGLGVQTWASADGIKTSSVAAGIFLGEPTGLTVRLGLAKNQSLEAKAAWSLVNTGNQSSSLTFQANYLFEFPGILVIKTEDFPLYVGIGAETQLGSSASFNVRVPFGVFYRFKQIPLELNLEFGLGLQVFPATSFVGSGGLGVRYLF